MLIVSTFEAGVVLLASSHIFVYQLHQQLMQLSFLSKISYIFVYKTSSRIPSFINNQ